MSSPYSSSKRLLEHFGRWHFTLIGLTITLFVLAGFNDLLVDLWRLQWLILGSIGLGLIVLLRQFLRADWLSPVVIYAGIFWVFHFGLVFPASIIPEMLDDIPFWNRDWLFTRETNFAVTASLLFMTCFALGAIIIPRSATNVAINLPRDESVILMGWLAIAAGILLYLSSFLARGTDFFLQPYSVFYADSNIFAYSVYLVSYGLILHLAGGMRIRNALIVFATTYIPIALPTLLAGSRTSVMFCLVVLSIILGKRGIKPNTLAILIFVSLSLALTGTLREVRQYGLGELSAGQITTEIQSPLSGLSEIGASLRPVYASVDYFQNSDYLYGETYFYPLFRQIARLAGESTGTHETDIRFIASYINYIYGSIGFSTVAEAHVNGGLVAIVIFSVLWGIIVRTLDDHANTSIQIGLLGGVLIPMLVNIRNSFIFVPAWIFLAIMPLLIVIILKGTFFHAREGEGK